MQNIDDVDIELKINSKLYEKVEEIMIKPRNDNDCSLVFSMPEKMLKKYKEKINYSITYIYNLYKDSGTTMFEILISVEPFLSEILLKEIIDKNIKNIVKNEIKENKYKIGNNI